MCFCKGRVSHSPDGSLEAVIGRRASLLVSKRRLLGVDLPIVGKGERAIDSLEGRVPRLIVLDYLPLVLHLLFEKV